MKKTYIILSMLLIGIIIIISCKRDEPDNKSIFDTSTPEMTEFDKWLRSNYTSQYNVEFIYRLDDREVDHKYHVVPVKYEQAVKMAKLLKFLWYEAYDEVAGINFMRSNSPRVLHLIGSAEYNKGSIRLGAAEGGIKITITMVNSLDPTDFDFMNEYFFKTMHHEFSHILHQKIDYPKDFELISAKYYSPTGWHNRKPSEWAPLGFVSNYASSEGREDFVETIANYIVKTDAQWEEILTLAGNTGKPIIIQKLEICRNYLKDSWNVDIDKLREVVQRRQQEIKYLNLDVI